MSNTFQGIRLSGFGGEPVEEPAEATPTPAPVEAPVATRPPPKPSGMSPTSGGRRIRDRDIPNPLMEDDNPMLDDDEEERPPLRTVRKPPEKVVAPPPAAAKKAAPASKKTPARVRREIPKSAAESGEERAAERSKHLVRASRYRPTEGDRKIFEFLGAGRYATSKHFALLNGWTERRAKTRAEFLFDHGYLEKRRIVGASSLYYLSTLGVAQLEVESRLVEKDFGAQLIEHTLQVNRIMAAMLSGAAWENNPDRPLKPVPMDLILSEPALQSAMRQEHFLVSQSVPEDARGYHMLRDAKVNRLRRFTANGGHSAPESEWGNEWMFALYGGAGRDYHLPDLVFRAPRASDGTPRATAIEVELSVKKKNDYFKIFDAYKREFQRDGVYGRVLWICKTPRIETVLRSVSESVGIPPQRIGFLQAWKTL